MIPLTGALDRIGRPPTMVAGASALLVSTAGFAFADSLPLLVLTRAVQGSAAALVWTAGLAAISDVYPQSELGFRMGMAETVGGGIGLIGPVAGGALIELVGTDEAFAIAIVVPLALLALTLRVPETTHVSRGRATAALRRSGGSPRSPRPGPGIVGAGRVCGHARGRRLAAAAGPGRAPRRLDRRRSESSSASASLAW